ncbi:P-type conjugative transfer protein TrbL [Brevundimonas sp. SL130]|uniref:P-type conjugative transfer protein TrbL n=1 Tax=Brevundimonas sp. SL130 TaxID=2995143 RepID=UPI00226CC5CB|nr:P-type conjugative transfer protein TrbL [Brevundimonas sp. SL130]WAC61384.1 P-type conjugative transfer protein TrbL [Brevundimonas sp. SL130]
MAVGMETPNELMVVFSNTVTAGFTALEGSVNGVFGLMIALVVALTGIQWALSPNREILAGAFGKVLLVGVFAWLINDWQRLAETIYAGFIELGLTAGGGALSRADFLNPSAVLAQGWEIVKAIGETPRAVDNPLDIVGNLADALILGLAMIGILLAFAVLALQIIVCLLEFKIVTLGGFVLLPFGVWSKSAFLAERPLGYVVSSGLKVLALAIVVSGARTVFDQLQPSTAPDIYEALSILVAAILLAMLAMFIPSLAAALVTGGPALGAGAALTGGLAVAGAGVLAGAGVMGAGAATGAGALRLSTPARSAAGAGTGRAASSPGGGSGSAGPAGGGGGGSTPPRTPSEGPRSAASGPDQPSPGAGDAGSGGDGSGDGAKPGRSQATLDRETEKARADFHKAAATSSKGAGNRSRPPGRSAALQAFFLANAGRGLMPSGETSGTLSPTLKTEEP